MMLCEISNEKCKNENEVFCSIKNFKTTAGQFMNSVHPLHTSKTEKYRESSTFAAPESTQV